MRNGDSTRLSITVPDFDPPDHMAAIERSSSAPSGNHQAGTSTNGLVGDLPIGPLSRELLELLSRPDSTEEEAVAAFRRY